MKKIILHIILFTIIFSCEKLSQEINSTPENIEPKITPSINRNQKIKGKINFTAHVKKTIQIPVNKIEFYFNNTLEVTDSTSPYKYNLDTNLYDDGNYTFQVKIYYESGDVGIYHRNIIIANNATKPAVNTNIIDGQVVNGLLNISAATDANVSISKAEFYINNALQATDNTAPYEYNWDSTAVTNGTYEIKTIVYDDLNNTGEEIKSVTAINYDIINSTIHHEKNALYIANSPLDNGKYVVVYYNPADDKGYYTIYDAINNSEVKSPADCYCSGGTDIALSTILGNEFVISYRMGSSGLAYNYYNNDGDYITMALVGTTGTIDEIASISYDYGNKFAIAFNNGKGHIHIIDATTRNSIDNNTFPASPISNIAITHTDNQNKVVLVYQSSIDSKLHYDIYDGMSPTLSRVNAGQAGMPINTNISATHLYSSNTNFIWAQGGYFYNSGINTFDAAATDISIKTMNDGNLAIAYKDGSNTGQFNIYQPDGTKLFGPMTFSSGNPQYINIMQLSNDWLVISYRDQNNNGYITSVVIAPK